MKEIENEQEKMNDENQVEEIENETKETSKKKESNEKEQKKNTDAPEKPIQNFGIIGQIEGIKLFGERINTVFGLASEFSKIRWKIAEPIGIAAIAMKQMQERDNQIKSLISSATAISRVWSTYTKSMQIPVLQWMEAINTSALYSALKKLKNFDFERLNRFIMRELYDAHWCPSITMSAEIDLQTEIIKIIERTRKSKNRIKQIDKAVFAYYTEKRVEEIKKSWRERGVQGHMMRILHQAVQAYHRKEYAITVIVLATQWEGIIYDKVHDDRRRRGNRTKENLGKLVTENRESNIIQEYFENFIVYQCEKTEETIPDTPGRHSAAHSFYNRYPSRKAALNAILFTDFLLNLEEVDEEEEEENGNT